MKNFTISPPEADEFDQYYGRYISLVGGEDIISAFKNQIDETQKLLSAVSEDKANFRYAEDKWSIKEVVGHLIDGERIFAYRALRISRNDRTPIEGFEQDGYIENSDFDKRSLADLTEEFVLNRKANILMFQSLSETAWNRRGTASDCPVSVRALAYIMAGHELHHIKILKERYLSE